MKKHLSILFVILLLFALPASAFAALEQVGGVYQISTSKDLGDFRDMVNNGSGDLSAKLTEHIDLNGASWQPIGWDDGETDRSYRGTFEGNGFAIQNLTVTSKDLVSAYVDGSEIRAAGLFGVLSSDACIQNLSLEGVTIDVPDYSAHFVYAGAVAGLVLSGDIRNCAVQSAAISSGASSGGVAGENYGDIQTCTVTGGTITGYRAGGVAGKNDGGTIQSCTMMGGTITGSYYSGGVAGWNGGDIQTCTVTGGTITGTAAGGVAGENGGDIQSCTVTGGTITGEWHAGGVAGHMNSSSANVQNCAVFGVSISAESVGVAHSGAIVGRAAFGTIRNSVAMDGEKTSVSAVTSKEAFAGGALGSISNNNPLPSITYTYYPAGIVNTDGIFSSLPDQGGEGAEWAIGNIKPDEMPADYKEVTSYDAKLSADKLPSITAVIKQGIAVTIKKGASYELDLTPLPGTKEEVSCTWTLNEGEGIVSIDAKDLIVSVTGLELGTATVQCVVSGLRGAKDNPPLTLTCRVTVVEATTPTGGGSSSNCNSGVGAAFFALAGLFFIGKRKK